MHEASSLLGCPSKPRLDFLCVAEQALFASVSKHSPRFELTDALDRVFGVWPVRHRVEVGAKPRQGVPGQLEIAFFSWEVPAAHLFAKGTARVFAQVSLGRSEPRFHRCCQPKFSIAAVFTEVTGDARGTRARQRPPQPN